MRARAKRRKALLLTIVAAVACGVGVLTYATHLLRRSELQTLDARFSIRGRHVRPRGIVLVLIDNASLANVPPLPGQQAYPFARRYDAQVIDRLRKGGARTIAIDVEFARETRPADDNALIESLAAARGKTVLAATVVEAGGLTQVLGGGKELEQIGAHAGEAILPLDGDGVERRMGYSYNGLASFAVATAQASGHPVARSRFHGGTVPIDFTGPPGTIRSVSYVDVLYGRYPPDLFRGKIVIVGASAGVLQDYHQTAASGRSVMPGPEIWANAVDTVLRGFPLKDTPAWLDLALILMFGVAVPLGSLQVGRWRTLLEALLLAGAFTVAVQVAFERGWIVSYVYPLLALLLGTFGSLTVLYVTEAIERERVRDVFARFVPGGVVDQVLAITGENLRLGGVERDCTVLFSDLRGFTSFSETQPAARVIEVVNSYLNEMTEAILAAGGTLISYMGDGIMAIFGAPLEQEDHADRALRAAREMIGPRLDCFNAWLAEQGFDHSFRMGVGLNSGPVMAGNVGSEKRVEYTAIGDTTNTASRLEGLTKNSGTMLFVSDTTRERMHGSRDDLVPVGEFEIRGREHKLAVWTIAAQDARGAGEESSEERRAPSAAEGAPAA